MAFLGSFCIKIAQPPGGEANFPYPGPTFFSQNPPYLGDVEEGVNPPVGWLRGVQTSYFFRVTKKKPWGATKVIFSYE